MVVRDFDFVSMTFLPPEAEAVLLVDSDTVLTDPVALQPFEPIAWRYRQLAHFADSIDLI